MATLRGNLAHSAFERTFDYPEGERTWEKSIPWISSSWEELIAPASAGEGTQGYEDAIAALAIAAVGSAEETELITTSQDMVKSWFMMEKVNNFSPTELALPSGEVIDGREVYVRANVGKVPMHGYIDRVDSWEAPNGEPTWAISDYKGLAVTTLIPMPTGWTTMRDVAVGQLVLGSDGGSVVVTAKSEVHNRPCFRVSFADGASIVCDNVHLWQVSAPVPGENATAQMVVNTEDLATLVKARPGLVGIPWATNVGVIPTSMYEEFLENHVASQQGHHRVVDSVVPVDSVPTQCISVDAADNLYLATKDCVLTHNTGKLPAPRYRDQYFDQLRIYALLMKEQYGVDAAVLRLIFTKTADRDKGILTHELTPTRLKAMEKKVGREYDSIRRSAASGVWETKTGPLCNWCYFQSVCPAWNPEAAGIPTED
jgi:hypothetical protein